MSDEHRFLQDLVDADRGLLRTAAGLAQSGRTLEAIALLESELARTRSMQERPADMALLAKTAGIFSEAAGLTSQAADYYEEAFAAAEPDPITLIALAGVRWQLGQAARARSSLERAESIARSLSDGDFLKMIASIRARWASDVG